VSKTKGDPIMPSDFIDLTAPRFDRDRALRPQDLPHGIVVPPPELVEQVARERAKHPPESYDDAYAKLTLDDWTLTYYYDGYYVAYRSVPEGIEVLAVDLEEIGEFIKGKSQEERLTYTIKQA
jgi:hypothetical protein